jgi:hypothetical protein
MISSRLFRVTTLPPAAADRVPWPAATAVALGEPRGGGFADEILSLLYQPLSSVSERALSTFQAILQSRQNTRSLQNSIEPESSRVLADCVSRVTQIINGVNTIVTTVENEQRYQYKVLPIVHASAILKAVLARPEWTDLKTQADMGALTEQLMGMYLLMAVHPDQARKSPPVRLDEVGTVEEYTDTKHTTFYTARSIAKGTPVMVLWPNVSSLNSMPVAKSLVVPITPNATPVKILKKPAAAAAATAAPDSASSFFWTSPTPKPSVKDIAQNASMIIMSSYSSPPPAMTSLSPSQRAGIEKLALGSSPAAMERNFKSPGKSRPIGLVLANRPGKKGVLVSALADGSQAAAKAKTPTKNVAGKIIARVDDIDVSDLSAAEITSLLDRKKGETRIKFLNVEEFDRILSSESTA